MRVLRVILRVVGWVLLSVLALVLFVCVAVYIPAVQQFAVNKASEIVAEKTGLEISIDRFRVRFPLGVSLRGTEVVMPSGDTLARVERLSTNVSVNLRRIKNHQIVVRRVALAGADIRLGALLADTTLFAPKADTLPPSTFDWSIRVRRVEIARSRFTLAGLSGAGAAPATTAFDPNNIVIDSLDLSARNILYAGSDLSASLEGLSLVERSGLRIVSGKGDFAMSADDFSLSDFELETARSRIEADGKVGAAIVRLEGATPVSADVSGKIDADEVMLFVPFPVEIAAPLRSRSLTLDGKLDGTLDEIDIEHLTASMPDRIDLTALGKVRDVMRPRELSANASLEIHTRDLEFAKAFLPDTATRRRLAFPNPMTLVAQGTYSPDNYELKHLTLTAGGGSIEAEGSLALKEQTYDARVRVADFPLGEFLPRDSLGAATLALTARGSGFDPFAGMAARVWLRVSHLIYKEDDLGNMSLAAWLRGGRLGAHAEADNKLVGISLDVRGEVERDASARRYIVDAALDRTQVRVDSTLFRIDSTMVHFETDPARTLASVKAGDLALDVTSPLPLDSLVRSAASTGREVSRQLAARHFSADSLQSAFPEMKFTASAGRANMLREVAQLQGLDFRSLSADISTLDGAPFSVDAQVRGLGTGKFTLDTINFDAHRNGPKLDYELRVANRPGNNDHLGLVLVTGSAGGNTLNVNIEQRNRADSVGFRFGVDVSLAGKTLHAKMTPSDAIFAYEPWNVGGGSGAGSGDWVEWDTDGTLRADLHLTGPSTSEYVNLSSASLPDIPQGALKLAMEGLDLGAMLDLLPAPPPIGGALRSDVTFGFRDGIIAAKGTLGVANFSYSERRVADIDADLDFQSDATGRMVLSAGVDLDENRALTASGYYTAADVDFAMTVPGLPLSIASGFLPPEIATLAGNIDGNLRIRGLPTEPTLTGDVGFTDASADVLMTGTTLRLSSDRIVIADNRIMFNGLGVISPNNQKLSLTGNVNIADLKKPVADLTLAATNFRVVDSQHIGGSQVYGTAAFDASVTARGPLSAMLVRGSVDVLDATNVFYILRNQSRVKDEKQHIVEFRDFAADSINLALADPELALPSLAPRVDMLVGVTIEDGVRATLSLDELSENRVALVGGGSLNFSMNPQGDVRLGGRYTLSGGTIYYKPPMIGQKIFAVSDGSYVEWTGEVADPEFHVLATQTSDIEITYDQGASEQVEFDISIEVGGSLAGMDMRFDVAAPGNLAIQNQLLAMSEEERMRQALTLLITGQYNGPGFSTKGGAALDARQQIGDFISKEVNQWARNNLKGVDFQMGIESRNVAGGDSSHMDYSYSVSKSMLNDRMKVTIGGTVSDDATSQNFAQNLLGDVALEYRLTRRDNMFARLYRTSARESILEGEVTETGAGFMLRKKINKLGDLFRRQKVKNEK